MESEKKINLLYLNYSYDIGGIETLVLNMCRYLDKSKFNMYICSLKKDNVLKSEFEEMNIPLHVIVKKEGIDIGLIFKLRKLFRKLDIDIVHTHNAAQWFYGALAVIGLNKPKIIHTQHSVLEQGKNKLLYSLRFLAKKTAFIVCVAEYVADYMVNKGKLFKEKVKVVYNGITVEKFELTVDGKQKKESLGVPAGYKLLGIVARLVPVKDHKTLLDALKLVLQKGNKVKLLIAGGGELAKDLEEHAIELEIEKEVVFLGKRRDIPEILNVLDIFILSSISEGLSVTLLESMASGLPVVATDVGGNAEVVIQGKTGVLVPSGNSEELARAIIGLLENEEKTISMGREGKKQVREKFNIEKMINEYRELYSKMVNGH